MTAEDQARPEPARLPIVPQQIRTVTLAELGRISTFVQNLRLEDWSKRSAASDWTIGDVVVHLNLAFGLYGRLLDAALAGKGAGGVWKAFGDLSKRVAPVASSAFNAINSAIPRIVDRALSPEVIQAQFVTSTRSLQDRLMRIGPEDYTRPIYYMGGKWPLSFFLAMMVNEMAIHGWDMTSRLDSHAHLSEDARSVLPWFFWSGTPFMLHMPKGTTGVVQVSLSDPMTEMWWDIAATSTKLGIGAFVGTPDTTLTGASGTLCLTLAGRLDATTALQTTSLNATGNENLARTFLGAWKYL